MRNLSLADYKWVDFGFEFSDFGRNEGGVVGREDELQGPPSRTRASLKRRHHEPSSSKIKVEKKLNPEDRSRKEKTHAIEPLENSGTDAIFDEAMVAPSITQPLPDKQALELIIDTLQRKDIYEIFAEPVDPLRVEECYEIIEEPMDFGTMRAKLHEGLYTSFEQFEHDVYLISGNAVHFNSSGTIFFRQAHGIDKLAKRVFHVLRTSPENFESEFGGNRLRSFRRSEDGFQELNCKLFFKTPDKRGGRDGKDCDSIEVDRRSTYKPPSDLNNEKYSKSLIQLHQHHQEHSYRDTRDSLLQFVKDLGPQPKCIVTHSHITQDQDMRSVYGTDHVERTRDSMVLSYSGGHMDSSVITSASMPVWLRQASHGSRFPLYLDFLKSKMGEDTNYTILLLTFGNEPKPKGYMHQYL
ncbi:bromodomain-containing protein [Artemisia annua]|uniref:Bromodomain-containing protein n=1 Tax=Artemisia annua TaxID=35608 RepID=A0A2U1QHF9_ARTAN|nr:bromodomain-containing protein [Artemisia annua]